MTTTAEKLALIATLRSDYDHCFLIKEGVLHFTQPFGFDGQTYVAHANPNDPKGLTLDSGAASAEGCAADQIAVQICQHLGLTVPQKMGRGFRLRAACDTIEQHLKSL